MIYRDLLWLNNPSKKMGISQKLQTFWEEEQILSDVVVKKKSNKSTQQVVNLDSIQKVRRPEQWTTERC